MKQVNLGAGGHIYMTGPGYVNMSQVPLYNSNGHVQIDGSVTLTLGGSVTRPSLPPDNYSYYQTGSSAVLDIESGSNLGAVNGVWVDGGLLRTLYNSNLADTVAGQTATITGKLGVTAGEVLIGTGGSATHYGTLYVIGTVSMTGGTYKPYLDPNTSGKSDLWKSSGNFTVGGTATLTPRTAGGAIPIANGIWTIISSTNATYNGTFGIMNLVYDPSTSKSYTPGTTGAPANAFILRT